MAGKIVCIRVNEDEWEQFKDVAESVGMSRNRLINLFISSIISGRTQIQQQANVLNVNVNLVPITNTNLNVAYQQTKVLKNELILDELVKRVEWAEKLANNGDKITSVYKEGIKKLISQASFIPPDLFERARRIILS